MKIYNTLTKSVKEFDPINPPFVGMYSCGPTVYDFQHIGHMRRYVGDDILIRVLKHNGYDVKHVMNITDVGHLVSDEDSGDDKMELGAKKAGLTVWDLAKKFEEQFWNSIQALKIERPNVVLKATETIPDQIEFIKILEEKAFTYKTSDGIYFDTAKFPQHSKLVNQKEEELKKGARVDFGEKKNPNDFALWKFSPKDSKRQMEWDSPWGKGFPGWHIECSTMSIKELGPTFDIHTGGIDHIPIHHQNEIIQSEAASGKKFVNYWVHHAFLLINGHKMSKSLGNFVTVADVVEQGYDPLALRYLYFQTHYRQEMNFTWESLAAAQKALENLWEEAFVFANGDELDRDPSTKIFERWRDFEDAINEDLNMPKALAAIYKGLSEKKDDYDAIYLLKKADEILGLDLKKRGAKAAGRKGSGPIDINDLPSNIQELLTERKKLRKEKRYHLADEIRHKLNRMGYDVLDDNEKMIVKKIA